MTWMNRLEREFIPGVCRKDLFLSVGFASLALVMLGFGCHDHLTSSRSLMSFLPAGMFLALSFCDSLVLFSRYVRVHRLIRYGHFAMAKIVSVGRQIETNESLDGTIDQTYRYVVHLSYITWNGHRCLTFHSKAFGFDIEPFLVDSECAVYIDRSYEFQCDRRDDKHYYVAIDSVIDWAAA